MPQLPAAVERDMRGMSISSLLDIAEILIEIHATNVEATVRRQVVGNKDAVALPLVNTRERGTLQCTGARQTLALSSGSVWREKRQEVPPVRAASQSLPLYGAANAGVYLHITARKTPSQVEFLLTA